MKLQRLSACPLFAGLEDNALARLAGAAREVRLAPGGVLFQKGDPGEALFVVVRGSMQVVARSRGGEELTLNQLHAGDYLGEIALFDGRKRTADAVADGAAELLSIARRDLLRAIGEHPEIAARIMERLCAHLRRTTDGLEDLAFFDAPQRLARSILQLIEDGRFDGEARGEVTLSVTQADLGARSGLSRVTVNQTLQRWKRKGWIALARRRLIVRDPVALAALITD